MFLDVDRAFQVEQKFSLVYLLKNAVNTPDNGSAFKTNESLNEKMPSWLKKQTEKTTSVEWSEKNEYANET